jgi:hypothetical protein
MIDREHQPYDKSSKWLIQHHGDSMLRLANVSRIAAWRPVYQPLPRERAKNGWQKNGPDRKIAGNRLRPRRFPSFGALLPIQTPLSSSATPDISAINVSANRRSWGRCLGPKQFIPHAVESGRTVPGSGLCYGAYKSPGGRSLRLTDQGGGK